VAQVLELAQLAHDHGEPEVDVGSGGIDAELDVEGVPLASFLRRSPSSMISKVPREMIFQASCCGMALPSVVGPHGARTAPSD